MAATFERSLGIRAHSTPLWHPDRARQVSRARRNITKRLRYKRAWLYPLQEHAIFYPRDSAGVPARFSFIEASTKTGKTVGCIAWLFEQALFAQRPNQNYWWLAPVYGQAKMAFTRMKNAYPRGTFIVHETELRLTVISSGAQIWFKSAEKPDNLFGEDVWAAVFDEASRGREEAWHALRTVMTATRGPVRFIGNVKGRRNWFYALARRAEKGEAGMAYFRIVAGDAVRAGVLSAQEIEEARRVLPIHVFNELYLAIPSDDGGNPFGLGHIDACVAPMSVARPVAFGVDLGKAQDWTVIIGLDRDGSACFYERFQRPWPETVKRIHSVVGMTRTLVDSTGLGDPVLAFLQQELGHNIEGYNFSGPSKQKLMEGLAVDIQGQHVHYPDCSCGAVNTSHAPDCPGVLKAELCEFEFQVGRTGVRYSAPEGYHDDTVCALALAAHHKRADGGLDVWAKLGGKR